MKALPMRLPLRTETLLTAKHRICARPLEIFRRFHASIVIRKCRFTFRTLQRCRSATCTAALHSTSSSTHHLVLALRPLLHHSLSCWILKNSSPGSAPISLELRDGFWLVRRKEQRVVAKASEMRTERREKKWLAQRKAKNETFLSCSFCSFHLWYVLLFAQHCVCVF